jgi:hypothetical protein
MARSYIVSKAGGVPLGKLRDIDHIHPKVAETPPPVAAGYGKICAHPADPE